MKSAKITRQNPYPKPGATGGRLIREVLRLLSEFPSDRRAAEAHRGEELNGRNRLGPLDSDILIVAVSGGADSIALAHLLIHYGRRVASREQIRLLHINHGWRGTESDADAAFVKACARKWRVPIVIKKLKPPKVGQGQSWEEEARSARKKIFAAEAKRLAATVVTAHHADDLAETVLWRILTGAHETHGGGIAVRHGVELRPCLRIRKDLLKQYLKEEGEAWREDSTNYGGRFLRARMRSQLMPELEKLFPRAIERLVTLALDAQRVTGSVTRSRCVGSADSAGSNERCPPLESPVELFELDDTFAPELLLQAAGIKIRRPHWELLRTKLAAGKLWKGEIHLPGGWKLLRMKRDQWVLEKMEQHGIRGKD